MAEIIFLYADSKLIPADLIRATHGFDDFQAVHLEYWRKYGGQEGLCTYRDAYEYLSSDMQEHGLPVRYSNYLSFKATRSRHR